MAVSESFAVSLLATLGFAVCSLSACAQEDAAARKVIRLQKPNAGKERYIIDTLGLHEVAVSVKMPRQDKTTPVKKAALSDAGVGLGGGNTYTYTVRPTDFIISGKVDRNIEALNWSFDLYCPGEKEKSTKISKNEDGGFSLGSSKIYRLDWQYGAWGLIKIGSDTLGKFSVSLAPRSDTSFAVFRQTVYTAGSHDDPVASGNRFFNTLTGSLNAEYGLSGTFKGNHLVLLTNNQSLRTVVFYNGVLQCTYQSDYYSEMPVKKMSRVHPFLMVERPKTDEELRDLILLSLLSRTLAATIGRSDY